MNPIQCAVKGIPVYLHKIAYRYVYKGFMLFEGFPDILVGDFDAIFVLLFSVFHNGNSNFKFD